MISNLKERSFATKVYISPCSWVSSPLASRDLDNSSQKIEELQADGNTQDLLTYLKSSHHDICLISIGFTGMTSCSQDIVDLIDTSPSLKK